uniref:Uncharacterized protein n=1 Tax=Paramoeba aestuarina TaxID=180227 RepID=A0A7S4N9G2_9EUKA|mmetsp:Transcript_12880/g.19808  ORF Transcript_12880/g.19808 Transcript_12880/m.19808 type:complete len:507 (+) Transcript_12880:815-2335(+)|eukprot:CAMPEP_0201506458 /NCGR_PEP_ID=MMETSP0161_2-20130828/364_1 /ASSEMBLY_ACC=CAM_ASM_000251 /TAXON_ID=180227 /ORGANISM="Neoparamoeba aestuarina, Strain SoJaBio B1-5/56/2" /LENGTH=506 /DNA_ID=CAMNT_0047900547 /DNA_START=94 /DNA_END=1614 /DNA_ORIENTATION=-
MGRSCLSLLLVLALVGLSVGTFSPLKYFVNFDDGSYAYNVSTQGAMTMSYRGDTYTLYNLFLTSGHWLTNTESNTYTQTHWLQFCIPDTIVDPTTAYLWIDGYTNREYSNPPTSLDTTVSIPCTHSNTLSFGLYQIPNAPVYFTGDASGQRRTEDAIIAWTWAHYINNTLEPDWLARMPMTRAGIRAMDAAQQFWDTIRGSQDGIEQFVVAGASKRGWTTWMVGAMDDPRVVSIVPVVAPIANLIPQMNEQWQSYNGFSWVLKDYIDLGLMGFLNLPVFEQLLEIIDPLSYRGALSKIAKYEIGATNDEFFMPDALKFYWDDIPGEKLWRIIPNCDHTIVGHAGDALRSFTGYIASFKKGTEKPRPVYSWEISEDAMTITVTATTEGLVKAKVWESKNKKNRDWRAAKCATAAPKCANAGAYFTPNNVTELEPGVFTYTIDPPTDKHYTAFFIELSYELYDNTPEMVVTSDVAIAPREMPFPPCPDDKCACGWNCAPGIDYYGDDE